MLKRTPRTGWQFLGSGAESVAEHSLRVAMITFGLLRTGDGELNESRALCMALFHDLPEARTGDLNYLAQRYVTADEQAAIADQTAGLPFAEELSELLEEFRRQETPEALLVRDADNLEMLLELKEHHDVGNPNAEAWVPHVVARLRTEQARRLAEAILGGHTSDWWFDADSSWWVRGGKT